MSWPTNWKQFTPVIILQQNNIVSVSIRTLADFAISNEPWEAGADVGRASSVAALSPLRDVTGVGAFVTGVPRSINPWGEENVLLIKC